MAALNKTICRDLNMIGENDLDVILRAHRDAKRRGIPIQHYIDQIPPAKLKAFTPEQLDLLYSGDPKAGHVQFIKPHKSLGHVRNRRNSAW